MTRKQRLQRIRYIARTHVHFSSMSDPASLAREPTRIEREQLGRASDLAGAQAGAAWIARRSR